MDLGNYIIVNFHYVRDLEKKSNGFFSKGVDSFNKKVKLLKSNYKIVNVEDVYKAAIEEREGNFCAITFDDGLKEHYKDAFRILKNNNTFGTFFVIGGALDKGLISMTHKLHFILDKLETREIVDELHEYFENKYIIGDKERINPNRRFDDILTSNLKETLIKMPLDDRKSFMDYLFNKIYGDEESIGREFFLNADEIKEMHNGGMVIGGHTYNHLALNTLDYDDQYEEIKRGNDIIREKTGINVNVVSYPHGRYNSDTIKVLEKLNIKNAVILGGRDISKDDEKFIVPRYDENDIKI